MQTFVSTCHLYTYYRSIDSNHQKASFVGTRASAISPCHLDVAPAPVCRVRDLDQHTEVHTSPRNGMERLGIERHPCITLLPLCVFFSLSLSPSLSPSPSLSLSLSLSFSLSPSHSAAQETPLTLHEARVDRRLAQHRLGPPTQAAKNGDLKAVQELGFS